MTEHVAGPRRLLVTGADPWRHDIPDDGLPHAPTTECGCGPILATRTDNDGVRRSVFLHSPDEGPDEIEAAFERGVKGRTRRPA